MILATLYAVGASQFVGVLPLTETSSVVVDRPDVRVRDVVVLQDLALKDMDRERLAALGAQSLLKLRPGQTLDLTHAELKARLVRRVPGLSDFEVRSPSRRVSLSYSVPTQITPTPAKSCWRLEKDLMRGQTLVVDDVREVACETTPSRAVGFDRASGFLRASRDLVSGEMVASEDPSYLARLTRGAALDIVVTRGPVQVSRPVTLVHDLRKSGTALVRTSDDQLLRAHLELKDAE